MGKKKREAGAREDSTNTHAPARARDGKPGPKPARLDPDEVRAAAALQCTHAEIASIFGLSASQFRRRMTAEPELRAAYDLGVQEGRKSLRRIQMDLAEEGGKGAVQMAIHLGKQYLGQTDVLSVKVDKLRRELEGLSDEELERRHEAFLAELAQARAEANGEGADG